MVARKSEFFIGEVSNKISELVGSVLINLLNFFKAMVKLLSYSNGEVFFRTRQYRQALRRKGYFGRPFAGWKQVMGDNLNELLR